MALTIPANQEVIEAIKRGEVNIAGPLEKDEILEYLVKLKSSDAAYSNKNLIKNESGYGITNTVSLNGQNWTDYIYLINPEGKLEAIISEIELINPFFFKNIVIAPGTDAITCYDSLTGESSTNFIR